MTYKKLKILTVLKVNWTDSKSTRLVETSIKMATKCVVVIVDNFTKHYEFAKMFEIRRLVSKTDSVTLNYTFI